MALIAMLTLAPLPGWQAGPAAPATHPAGKQAVRPKAPPAGDAQLETTIRGKFAQSKISLDHFTVRVQGGVATLEGKTDVLQHKGTATRLARIAGARVVNNRIQVSEAARNKAKQNLQEGRRRVQVKRSEPR